MKYITEEELRDLCKIQTFETFTLNRGVKLTPGGRQFLVDRKIPIIELGEQKANKTISIPAENCREPENENNPAGDPCINARFALLEAVFFKQVMELLEKNGALANQIYEMKCGLESIECGCDENQASAELCGVMEKESLKYPQKECFRIRRDVMFAEHGKEAAALHLLRCELQNFYFDNSGILDEDQKNHLSYLMNRLSQMIGSILGRDHGQEDEGSC